MQNIQMSAKRAPVFPFILGSPAPASVTSVSYATASVRSHNNVRTMNIH